MRGVVSGAHGETHHLEPKAMDVFVCLAEHANEVVTRNQLLDVAWNGSTAFDEQLTRVVGDLRRALHDHPGDPTYIETVPKRGYRLIGQVRLIEASKPTRTGRRKLSFVIVAALALAFIYFAYNESVVEQIQVEGANETTAWQRSIAVLPFVNMSDDPGNDFFADGLSEEILNLLAKVPGLKVIGRTSSFSFKGKNEDLRVIGQILGVKTVLEGSVRKSGEQVRITAQLVDVSDGTHIWSESYDRTMTDIFLVQDEVAAAIIDALQIHVGAVPTRGRPTENTAAYVLFLKARISLNKWSLRDAEELLLEAIELDPKFAEAYELLASCYWFQGGLVVSSAEGQKLTYNAAAKALAIDPDLVFAQALYQGANIENESGLGAMEVLERANREQPGNPWTLRALVWELLVAGYLQEAVGVAERYVALDPLAPVANSRLFKTLYAVGRTSEALAALEVADQLAPDANRIIGAAYLVEKRNDIAIAHIEAFLQQNGYSDSNWVRELVAGASDPLNGQAYLDRRIPQIVASMQEEDAYETWRRLTTWYLFFGFLDRYFEEILDLDLDSSWTDADALIESGIVFRRLGFTAHPKYLEVAERMGFIELWEQRGPPDFCEKEDNQWVCE